MNEDESHIFGRIYTDNEINISESNIILEGNINYNNGDKAQLLNLSSMKNLCFFLGQILAIKGKKEINQYSIKYYVSSIYAGLPTHLKVKIDNDILLKHFNCQEIENDIKYEELDNDQILQMYNNDNIHIMVCNGYVYKDNDYSDYFDIFLKIVNEKLPHVVLIFGPFLYIRNFNEAIQKIGDINVIYDNIFKKITKLAKNEAQLSFFPSYPSEYNIEITKFKNLLFQPNRLPDIFLFPSFTNEKSYVKDVHKRLFICPYSLDLNKAEPSNFFSNIYILPPTETQELSKRVILENVFVRNKTSS
ncbi:hypothetical protein [Plasmodium yoelii yoelii]|uniref:DNA polymerase alpha subunit B OB domain-containing protein n=1 Tax=Plasmodium yoelii yoelii TaxID=73239 RepID=Q7RGU0_PLAYO|nr:hypothetical protein [Plasmodium yoelii yoelii]